MDEADVVIGLIPRYYNLKNTKQGLGASMNPESLKNHATLHYTYNNQQLLFFVEKEKFETLFDIEIDERIQHIGLDLLEVIHPDDVDLFAIANPGYSLYESFELLFRVFKKNKEIVILKGKFNRLSSGGTGNYPAFLTELIDAKSLSEKSDELNSMKINFQAMMERTDDFIFFKDANHIMTMSSDSLAVITGYKKGYEIVGKTDYEIFPKEYADAYHKLEKEIYKGNIPCVEEVQPFVDENNQAGWINNRKYPIRNSSGEIIGLFGIARNITKQIQLQQELTALNANLHEMIKTETDKRVEKEKLLIQQTKMATMGEMIGAIAHQWKQPLNALAITVQDAEMAYRYGELDNEYMATYKKEAMQTIQNMTDTIEDFRKFFSPNKKTEEFFVEDAIAETLKMLEPQLKTYEIEIRFDKDTAKKHLYSGCKNELKQVFLNILANAKDALLEKKPSRAFIKMDVNATDNNKLEISIEDSAGGIPEEIINKVFDSYFTTKGEDKGTGIGLYMSKQIVEDSLHGKLSVGNTENGAMFVVEVFRA